LFLKSLFKVKIGFDLRLVQLTDNLDDYSIFHLEINRNQKDNTMDILFVASSWPI